jgi:hypothetical protein
MNLRRKNVNSGREIGNGEALAQTTLGYCLSLCLCVSVVKKGL